MKKLLLLGLGLIGLLVTWGLFITKKHVQPYETNLVNNSFLLVHILGSSLSFIAAPFLFLKNTVNKKLYRIHKPLGKIYVIAVLSACLGGLYINQFVVNGGFISQLAFLVQFLAWAGTTYMAYYCIRRHWIIRHSMWIVRSVAITASFAVHALWVRFFLSLMPADRYGPTVAYNAGDWLTWLVNLLIAEVVISVFIKNKFDVRYQQELRMSH